MRVAFASAGVHLPFTSRLEDEGVSTLTWTNPDELGQQDVGLGIVPKTRSWDDLVSFAEEGVEAGEPTLFVCDLSGMGDKADQVRKKGIHVIGGSKFCDKLEKNREYGFDIAEECGMEIPYYQTFSSITEGIKYAKTLRDRETYFKCDRHVDSDATYKASGDSEMVEYLESFRSAYGDRVRFVIQDKIEGVAISTENWFNGRDFIGPCTGIIEKKKLLNGDIGPSTGCSLNAVWFYQNDTCELGEKLNWSSLAAILRKHDAPPGVYDANAIVTEDGDAFFLEWCARFGYDSEPTGQTLISDYGEFLWHLATGQGKQPKLSSDLAYSIHLWETPYPFEGNLGETSSKKSCIGNHIYGISGLWGVPFAGYGLQKCGDHYSLAATTGDVGLALAKGSKLSSLNKSCLNYIKTIRPSSIGYRTDGAEVINNDVKELVKVLGDLPKGLLE